MVTTATRLIDIPCRYGMHLMIALRLPLDQVGAFYIVFGTMSLASGLGRLGVDRALTREMARALAHGDTATARAALWRSSITCRSSATPLRAGTSDGRGSTTRSRGRAVKWLQRERGGTRRSAHTGCPASRQRRS